MTAEVAEMAHRLNPMGSHHHQPSTMSTSNDAHIILDKELRRDIDAIIQRLKSATMMPISNESPREALPTKEELDQWEKRTQETMRNHRWSEERKDAIKSLQLAVMWLGMDLKAINDETGGAENPYPHSKDPTNTVIDKTADDLKL